MIELVDKENVIVARKWIINVMLNVLNRALDSIECLRLRYRCWMFGANRSDASFCECHRRLFNQSIYFTDFHLLRGCLMDWQRSEKKMENICFVFFFSILQRILYAMYADPQDIRTYEYICNIVILVHFFYLLSFHSKMEKFFIVTRIIRNIICRTVTFRCVYGRRIYVYTIYVQ